MGNRAYIAEHEDARASLAALAPCEADAFAVATRKHADAGATAAGRGLRGGATVARDDKWKEPEVVVIVERDAGVM